MKDICKGSEDLGNQTIKQSSLPFQSFLTAVFSVGA